MTDTELCTLAKTGNLQNKQTSLCNFSNVDFLSLLVTKILNICDGNDMKYKKYFINKIQ